MLPSKWFECDWVLIHLFIIVSPFLFSENQDGLHQVVHERLGELLRVLKAVINKYQNLNSVDILSAAGTVIAKVKGKELLLFIVLGNCN